MLNFTDNYMCDVGEVSSLSEGFQNLCLHTAKTIYDIKNDVKNAMLEFISAYTVLNENMKAYKKRWETLGDDFYQ